MCLRGNRAWRDDKEGVRGVERQREEDCCDVAACPSVRLCQRDATSVTREGGTMAFYRQTYKYTQTHKQTYTNTHMLTSETVHPST